MPRTRLQPPITEDLGLAAHFLADVFDMCNVTHYTRTMIRSFKHAGLERFFTTGSKAGIQPAHARKLNVLLTALDEAEKPLDMGFAGWNLHELKGEMTGCWSVKVNGNWRITFRFEGIDAVLVDYQDYH